MNFKERICLFRKDKLAQYLYENQTKGVLMNYSPEIKMTTDYTIFKKADLNRDIDRGHVKKIKRELEMENNLHLKPIICNKHMEVIYGQHRLEAAKELGFPIFYICDQNVSYEFILADNAVQKQNSMKDTIDFWSRKEKKEDYLLLQQYMLSTKLSPKSLLALLLGPSTRKIGELLRSGKFALPADKSKINRIIEAYNRFVDYCKSKRITPIHMLSGNAFASAFRNLVILDPFEEETFYRKMDMKWFDIRPQANHTEWTKHLLSIYNYKNKIPLPEDLLL